MPTCRSSRPRYGGPRSLLAPALAYALVACGGGGGGVLVGTVERTLIELDAPIAETLVEVGVQRGQDVRRGDVLARLDPTLVEADVANAEATLAGARTGLVTAESDLTRLTRLHASRVASEQDLERARLSRDEATARLREGEARLVAARHRLEDMTITSPVDGVVDQIPFDRGERVPAGGVVVVVLDAAAPWVRVWVSESLVATVRPGAPADVRVDGIATALHGHVLDVSHEPEFTPHFALTERDRVHLVYETRVAIDDAPAGLRPGVPAQVQLAPSGRNGA
ncbi:MAG TPA: efflux RND transporter periplasmic adaptor subunit [Candidatus Eisenbacteria bacterium]|nr:efflux RND transporter periplasmic adaptor subunit [Candidatus Eisenbacteria bacterium]